VAEHRYARLTETVNVSEDFADLANEDPLAAVVYAMTWTKCWPWAILPGKPMEFKATVCPLLDIGRERMQAILDALDRRGCIIGYEAPDGTLLRFSCQWHKHNPVKWQMVSLPKYAPPPCWEPPAAFIEWVSQHPQDTMAKWWQRQTVTNGYNGLQTKPAEATGGAEGGQSTLAVAVELDVTANDKGKGSAPPNGDAAPEPPAKPGKQPRAPNPPEEDTPVQAVIRAAWQAHGYETAPGGSGYAGLVKLVQAKGIPLAEGWVTHLAGEAPELPEGADPWPWFADRFRAALNRPWEWDGSKDGGNGKRTGKPFYVDTHGKRIWQEQWEPDIAPGIAEEEARDNWNPKTGRPKKSVTGWACSDEHPSGKPKPGQEALL
jgi:hypothetical protein